MYESLSVSLIDWVLNHQGKFELSDLIVLTQYYTIHTYSLNQRKAMVKKYVYTLYQYIQFGPFNWFD